MHRRSSDRNPALRRPDLRRASRAGRRDPPRLSRTSLHLVAVLKGAFVFLSDLVRHMRRRRLARLHGGVELRQGHDHLRRGAAAEGPRHGLEGRDVVIVEDIVDTGLTLTYLQDILRARGPQTLRTACLLSKPSRRKVDVKVDYIGFTIEDSSSSATASTTPSSIATCPTSASLDSLSRSRHGRPDLLAPARAPRRAPRPRRASAPCGRASAPGR